MEIKFEQLANDSIVIICQFLPTYDIVNLHKCSRRLHNLCRPIIQTRAKEEEFERSVLGQLIDDEVLYMFNSKYANQILELSKLRLSSDLTDIRSTVYLVTQIANHEYSLPSIVDLTLDLDFTIPYEYFANKQGRYIYRRLYTRNFGDLLLLVKNFRSKGFEQIDNDVGENLLIRI